MKLNRHLINPTPTLSLPPAFAEAASRRQAEGEGNRYVPPPSPGPALLIDRGGEGGG
jgi:hypothetical protein